MKLKTLFAVVAAGLAVCLPFKGSSTSWNFNFSGSPSFFNTVNSGVSIGSNKLLFNSADGNQFRRVYYDLGANLTTDFRMDFDFIYYTNPGGSGIAHWLTAATSNTLDPTCIAPISSAIATSMDLIGVQLLTPSATSPANAGLYIGVKKGTTIVLSSNIQVSPNTPYYITLERHGAGLLKLMVFIDAQRTTQITGSPICFTAFDNTVGTGATPLKHIQHSVVAWASTTRTMSGQVDNLKIDDITTTPVMSATASQTMCTMSDIPDPLTVSVAQPQYIGTYQWQVYQSSPFPGWNNIPGETTPTLTLVASNKTKQFRCLYTVGCATTYTSNTVKITVNLFNPLIDCNISDDYTVASPLWTQTGTDVMINTLGSYCLFKAAAAGPNLHRVIRTISTLPADRWRADFDFIYDPTSYNPNHYIAAFTGTNGQPGSSFMDMIYTKVITTAGNVQIWGGSRSFLNVTGISPTGITISSGTNYYISIERVCPTQGRISVFTDAGRTTHAAGSPQLFDIHSVLGALSYVQHSNDMYAAAGPRLTAQIDNMCIDNNYIFGGHRMASSSSEEATTGMAVKNNFIVYPNPSTDVFTITLDKIVNGLIEVYDISGKKVKSVELNQGLADYKLDLSGYSKGVYMLNVISEGKIQSKKIILE